MAILIPVASGKGGVGKTAFAANLGALLASHGKAVVLVDLDLGGANLHTYLGIRNKYPGLGSVIWKKENHLESLIIPTDIARLYFIPGDNLLPGTANLDFFTKRRIMNELSTLTADYVIADLGAGTAYNTVDFWLMAYDGLLVMTPETPSVLNAYSFIKTAVFRMAFRLFPKGSVERERIVDFIVNGKDGAPLTFYDFALTLGDGKNMMNELQTFSPRIVVNMGAGKGDEHIAVRLRNISKKNLGINVRYIAYILRDDELLESLRERTPIVRTRPRSLFARGVGAAANRITKEGGRGYTQLESDDDDLFSLVRKAIQSGARI